ncbi:septum site-determining protein Ssd [Nocardia sp. NBC_00511]|uniref:septum site-determining protein Ssd n=1 Tax=Nocardia sp. NBC_00511 TaxID=2903591 RepID=UPI0030E1A956
MNSDAAGSPALSLVADPRLREEIRRIAAAADRPLDERVPPVGRHAWAAASVVVLDLAAARSCVAAGHPRRPGILLVTEGEPGLLDWQAATAAGAEQVLALPAAADALIAAFAAHDGRRPGDGAVLAVAGAGAGAGASTLAAAVALTAAGRFRDRTLLVDCAPFGGGLDLVLGLEKTPGLRWPDLAIEDGRVAAAALHAALPATGGAAVLSCGRGAPTTELTAAAVRAVVEAGRAAGDLVVADLSSDHDARTDQALESADLVVLVAQARLRSIAAAESAVAYLGARNPNVRLVVRGPAPGGLSATEIAETLAVPLLAAVPSQPGLTERLERGGLTVRRRSPLRIAAETALTALFTDLAPAHRIPARPGPSWWRAARAGHAHPPLPPHPMAGDRAGVLG